MKEEFSANNKKRAFTWLQLNQKYVYRKILQNSGRPIKCQGWEGGGEMEYT